MSTDRFLGGVENLDGQMVAGSTLSAGDAVTLTDDNEVDHVSSAGDAAYGVVMYDAAAGDPVAVATTGAKVRVNAADTAGPGAAAAQTDGTVDDATSGDAVLGFITVAGAGGDAHMLITGGGAAGGA